MKIIVLFKTHLDIGFTDFSENVVKKYNEHYIPQAISVAREVAAAGRKEGFVWTTGSWLIAQYLEKADKEKQAALAEAIQKGWVSWHGLPFTLHSESCPAELFDYGLSLSKKLDEAFSKETIAAKYTDVPGHTVAIVPHLADHGIRLLHIGVNPASAAVEAPPLFRWQYQGKEIYVMYNGGDYGEFTQIPGTDTYVYFAHTGDNLGPQSAEEILKVYDDIYEKFPGAQVAAGTLNDVAREVEKIGAALPIVDEEMGDTWIHGTGSAPRKISRYQALLRHAKDAEEKEKKEMYDHLLLVPEHTWGLDEKTHLHDDRHYIHPLFEMARGGENYQKMEKSWQEQEKYVLDAASCIRDREKARALLAECASPLPDFARMKKLDGHAANLPGLRLSFSDSGEITEIFHEKSGLHVKGTLFGFSYDEYAYDEVWAFQQAYLKKSFVESYLESGRRNWAIDDFGKPGLDRERNAHTASAPLGFQLYQDGAAVYALYKMDEEIAQQHGLPKECVMKIEKDAEGVLFDFCWYGKMANRAPEAMWLSFIPRKRLKAISKLGYPVDISKVAGCGGKGLHATDGPVYFDGFTLTLLDTLLVSVGKKNIWHFEKNAPNMDAGVYLNLFNNQWGTNFPMWYEGDGRARFRLAKAKE